MHIIRSERDEFLSELLKFKAARKVQGIGNSFYFQSLTYGDNSFYLQVPSFHSNGMSISNYNNMRQMRVTFPKWQQTLLRNIDKIAQEQVQCPDNAPSHWNKVMDEGNAYKDIPDFDSLFLRLSDNFQAFDLFENVMDVENLKRGRYMALVHITGLYLGAHGTTGKLASLQMKVLQLVYEPTPIDKCLIITDEIFLIPLDDKKESDSGKSIEHSKKRPKRKSNNEQPSKLKRKDAQSDLKNYFKPIFDEESQAV